MRILKIWIFEFKIYRKTEQNCVTNVTKVTTLRDKSTDFDAFGPMKFTSCTEKNCRKSVLNALNEQCYASKRQGWYFWKTFTKKEDSDGRFSWHLQFKNNFFRPCKGIFSRSATMFKWTFLAKKQTKTGWNVNSWTFKNILLKWWINMKI